MFTGETLILFLNATMAKKKSYFFSFLARSSLFIHLFSSKFNFLDRKKNDCPFVHWQANSITNKADYKQINWESDIDTKDLVFFQVYLEKIVKLFTNIALQPCPTLTILFYYSLLSWNRAVRNVCFWLAFKDKYVYLINRRSSFGSMN